MAIMPPHIEPEESNGCGYIGRIPVRNLWLLMLYASDLFRTCGTAMVGCEETPDDLPDIVAEILATAVEDRQRRQFTVGYHSTDAVLARVRGRIDLLKTERHQLLQRGQVACHFDELTVNTPRNRLVRGALETISTLVKRPEVAHRCRSLAKCMKASGVWGKIPTRSEISTDRFGRHDADDRIMVEAAKLALDLALPTESAGAHLLPLPDREITWVRKLFEKAVAGFYHVVLSPLGWKVHPQRLLRWQVEQQTAGIDAILPSMKADIILDHDGFGRRIVIDTKFTSIVTSGWYRDETLRSGYLYQIYAYVRSQAGSGDMLADRASGLLLHPAIGETPDVAAIIQGHTLRFATVDLSATSSVIRSRLEHMVTNSGFP